MKLRIGTLILLLSVGAALRVAPAQETITCACVSGLVTDPDGAVVTGAQVTVRQTETNRTTVKATDREGRFRFPYLSVGQYEIRVSQPGFTDAVHVVRLSVGSALDLPIQLLLGSPSTHILVDSEAPVLEAARTQIAGTLLQERFRAFP